MTNPLSDAALYADEEITMSYMHASICYIIPCEGGHVHMIQNVQKNSKMPVTETKKKYIKHTETQGRLKLARAKEALAMHDHLRTECSGQSGAPNSPLQTVDRLRHI